MDDAATVANSPSLVLRVCKKENATLNTQRCSLANPHLSMTVLHPVITFKETIFLYWSSDMVLPSNCCCTCVGIFPPPIVILVLSISGACIVCCCREEPQFESFSFQPYSESSCVQRVQEWTKRHRQLPLLIFSVHGGFFNERKKTKQRKARSSLSNHVSPLPTVSAFILWHHMHFLQIFSCKTPCKHSSCSHIHNVTVFSYSHYRNNELVDACTQPRVCFWYSIMSVSGSILENLY